MKPYSFHSDVLQRDGRIIDSEVLADTHLAAHKSVCVQITRHTSYDTYCWRHTRAAISRSDQLIFTSWLSVFSSTDDLSERWEIINYQRT